MSAGKEVCAAGTSVGKDEDWDIPSSIRQGTLIRLASYPTPTVHSALRNSHAIRSHDVVSFRREAARHSTKDGLPLTYNRLVAMPLLFRFLLRDSLAARHPTPRLFLSADWAKNRP